MKPKKCAICREKFIPVRGIQPTCLSIECQAAYGQRSVEKAKRRQEKAERMAESVSRKTVRLRLLDMKPLSYWAKRAERACNAWIRFIDHGLPCISCAKHAKGKGQAGHYLSVKSHPELRYHPMNIHLQCVACNHDLSGNAIEYRKGLIIKAGIGIVEWLEGPHEPKRYRREDYQAIEAKFKRLLKEGRTTRAEADE